MSSDSSHTESILVESHPNKPHEVDVSRIDISMMILTWVAFLIVYVILQKFAWKPILTSLQQREEFISKSLNDAKKIELEMKTLEETKQEIIAKAQTESKRIVDESRKAAQEAAKHIQQKAKEEAQIILENARRDIKEEFDKAHAQLKDESITLAVNLAGKILEENLDQEKNRSIVNRILKDL